MAWWQSRGLLADFIVDLIHAELGKLRPGQALPPRPWPETLSLGEAGLGVDSLEKLTLAAALGQALRLDRSGLEDHLLARATIGAWVDLAEICLARSDQSMVFLTSGSTGEPKACEHATASLTQEAAFLSHLFADRRRIVSLVSSRHIYGFLFTVLLPSLLGIPVLRRLDRSTIGLAGELLPGDLVVGFPDLWRLAARSVERFPADVAATTSTAPLPPGLDAELLGRGLSRLVEIYGASETAGIGWREAPSPDFQLYPFWVRSLDGEDLLRIGPHGQRKPAQAQDHLMWSGDHRFRPDGRRDQAFQVGGVNVHPRLVEAVLISHPEVAEARIRPMRPEEGGRIKAFIVPRRAEADPAHLIAELDQWSARHLSPPERPKSYRFGPALPRDALGKPADWS